MPRAIHFEIHADNPQRATRFYQDVLGWTFKHWEGPHEYWLTTTGPPEQAGINGGLIRRPEAVKGDAVIAYVCTVDVPSVDEFAQRAVRAGGQVVLPKMPIPGIGWLAYCNDTEGNIFGMMHSDRNAG